MKKRGLSLVIVTILSMCTLVSCGDSSTTSKDDDTIKIGTIVPMTGKVSSFGQSAKEGVLLAEKQINAEGGIHGKK